MTAPTPYLTADDMVAMFEEEELIEATNLRDRDAVAINSDKLTQAIVGATGIIDGWLIMRYTIPLSNPSPSLMEALRIHGANIARYLLDGTGEDVIKKYDEAIEWLKAFTKEGAAGGDTNPGVDPAERFGSVSYGFRAPVWTDSSVDNLLYRRRGRW